MADPVDLDEVRRLCEAATPGPWSADPTGTVCADADLRPDGAGGKILPADGPMEVAECYRGLPDERGRNAAFIAAARDLVPALADEVERLRAELAALDDGPDEHVIDLRDDGWTIKHPLSCRPHLFDCPVNRAAERDLTEAPAQLGRFVCLLDEVGGFTIDTTPGGAR